MKLKRELTEIQVALNSANTDVTYKIPGKIKDIKAITSLLDPTPTDLIPTAEGTVIPAGIHSGRGITIAEPALISENIKAGITIFGVEGKTEVIDTSAIGAVIDPQHVLLDFQGFVNGEEIIGTCTFNADTTDADAVEADVALGKTFYSASGVKLTGTAI